jgi:hypothetical protein
VGWGTVEGSRVEVGRGKVEVEDRGTEYSEIEGEMRGHQAQIAAEGFWAGGRGLEAGWSMH